jgi:hypothetical protein
MGDTDNPSAPSTGMMIAIAVQSALVMFLVGFLIWYVLFHKQGTDIATDTIKTIEVPTQALAAK